MSDRLNTNSAVFKVRTHQPATEDVVETIMDGLMKRYPDGVIAGYMWEPTEDDHTVHLLVWGDIEPEPEAKRRVDLEP